MKVCEGWLLHMMPDIVITSSDQAVDLG